MVITATKSGGEKTAADFAQYWAEALASEAADTSKDQIVTAAEAYAASRTARSKPLSKPRTSMATEHARMEGVGAPALRLPAGDRRADAR